MLIIIKQLIMGNHMQNKYSLKLVYFFFSLFLSFESFAQKSLYAGIEIGSKGIKFSVIDVNNIKKGNYNVLEYWTENIGIAKNISIDGNIAEEDLNRAGAVVFDNFLKIKNKYNFVEQNIYIVVSSGVALARNTQVLRDKIKALTNKELDFISAEQEGKMLLKGCVPSTDYKDAVFLDIGGGNTKGGYVDFLDDNKSEFSLLKLDYGTITLTEAINKRILISGDVNNIEIYKAKSFDFTPVLREKMKEMMIKKSQLLEKKKIYLSGGAIWALTILYYDHKGEDGDNFVPLKMDDIINYDAVLKNNFIKYENLAKKDTEADKVLKTYSQKHLISGNTILISFLESIPDLQTKNIYFAKQGQIAWLVSYIVDRSKKIKNKF